MTSPDSDPRLQALMASLWPDLDPQDGGYFSYEQSAIAALAAADRAAWRDIGSAPKDGTSIMIFGPLFDKAVCVPADGGWWNSSEGSRLQSRPTHWQPLPAPPPDSDSEESAA